MEGIVFVKPQRRTQMAASNLFVNTANALRIKLIRQEDLNQVCNSVVVFSKYARLTFDNSERLKSRNNILWYHGNDFFIGSERIYTSKQWLKNIEVYDGVIAVSVNARSFLQEFLSNKLIEVIPEIADTNGGKCRKDFFEPGYYGTGTIESLLQIPGMKEVVDSHKDFGFCFNSWVPLGTKKINFHFDLRPQETEYQKALCKYKGNCKLATACWCGANIISFAQQFTAQQYLLPIDYRYVVKRYSALDVMETFKRAKKEFDSQIWFEQIEKLQNLMKEHFSIEAQTKMYKKLITRSKEWMMRF